MKSLFSVFSAESRDFLYQNKYMLKKEDKKKLVTEFAKELEGAKALYFSDFQGLPAKDIQDLRQELRKEGAKYKVVKLTLVKRALEQIGLDTSGFNFTVPVSVAYSAEDEITPVKTLHKFAKTHDKLKILAGYLAKSFLDAKQVKQLATLPGKQELRGQLVSVIASPLRGLASVLAGNIRGLLNVLNAKLKVQNAK